jgi:hypothetical protein
MALPKRKGDRGSSPPPNDQPDWHAHYDIENPSDVDAYVLRYPFLAGLLDDAPARIAQHFGPYSGLSLEAPVDPEDGTQHLYLYVRTTAPFEDVLARRDRLDDEWWLDAMLAARTRMTIDVEFA